MEYPLVLPMSDIAALRSGTLQSLHAICAKNGSLAEH